MSEGSSPSLFATTLSSATPTIFQPQPPTYVPSESPSATPSVEAFYFMDGSLVTQLYTNQKRSMNNVEQALFVGIMEGHTESIGNKVASPFIKTYCTILNQVLGTTGDTIVLQVSYNMNYTTNYGYDIHDYPELFRIFMNENNATTLQNFVDLIDVHDWSYIQEVGTTVAVTEENIMELITSHAPQAAPQSKDPTKPNYSGNSSNGSLLSSPTHNSLSDSDSPLNNKNSDREDTLVGVLLGFSIVILLTVVAGFIRVYRNKEQTHRSRHEGGITVLTPDAEDPHAVEDSIDQNAEAAITTMNPLDQPPSEETPPASRIVLEKQRNIKDDDDNSIMNEAIFTFALPIDVSDAEKGIITALDTPPAMIVEGEAHHDRFSSGLSPLSFLVQTESIDEVANGSNNEDASLGAPYSGSNIERTTPTSYMETTPSTQILQFSMSHDLLHRSSEVETGSVTFAPEVAQTVIFEQFHDSSVSVEVSVSHEPGEDVSEEVTSPQFDHGTFEGTNLMAIRSDSLSSESHDDESLTSQPSTGDVVDEFDKYRDHLLDVLTEEVESAVDNVHVPLRMAIAQLLTAANEQGTAPDLSWIGGEDLGSIEASCLCHACAWEEQNKDSSSGQTFYEDMLHKIVVIVHHGLLTPHDGARILHGCASIVGLTLLKELPNTTAVIQGLISTNELAHGHHLLVSAFERFGDIVDASICPQNRAFGYVRFANSESIDKVLNEPSVVIQDVAVSITSLLR